MHAGLIEGFLGLALLVIVPLALALHPLLGPRWLRPAVATAVPATLGLALAPSAVAAAVCVPWLLLSVAAAAAAALAWARTERTVASLIPVAASAYLVVGAAWLLLNRLGIEPVGISEPFVLLTAVHFSYAGFTATVLAWLVFTHAVTLAPRGAWTMAVLVVGAPPVIAAGFTFIGWLQIVGAVLLTLGLFLLAWLTLRHVIGSIDDRGARVLLGLSAVAVLVPMVLAVQWAVGWNLGTPALSIPAMARTHGVVNALGFALCGVLGWRRLNGDIHE